MGTEFSSWGEKKSTDSPISSAQARRPASSRFKSTEASFPRLATASPLA